MKSIFLKLYANAEFRSVPLGYWADDFEKPLGEKVKKKPRAKGDFAIWEDSKRSIDFDLWCEIQNQLAYSDENIKKKLLWADQVVVNGEGSIHHNGKRSLAILALCKIATDMDIRCYLLNCTLQSMSDQLMEHVLKNVDLIHVREKNSLEYCKAFSKNVVMSTDLAFLGEFEDGPSLEKHPKNSCLLTSGVFITPKSLSSQIKTLRNMGLVVSYLVIGDGQEQSVADEICKNEGVNVYYAEQIEWNKILTFLKSFNIVISGRHHINIFLTIAGIPFIPLPSNSWKIEGTLELVSYPVPICKNEEELCRTTNLVLKNIETYSYASYKSGLKGYNSAESLVEMIKNCKY